MPKFQIVTPHDPSQCMDALDDMMRHDPDLHAQVLYGCHSGDCTGYVVIDASTAEEARNRLPRTLRNRARVVSVERVTPEDIRASHSKAP